MTEFREFPKIGRYSREVWVTEKIDGTNSGVFISEDGSEFLTSSRTRWITPEDDNYGFSRWAHEHKQELMKLGPGMHFGEWWGSGIQRKYGLTGNDKRWSLFNVQRWCHDWETPKQIKCGDPRIVKFQEKLPICCGLVPVLWQGKMDDLDMDAIILDLKTHGSYAVDGWMKPEGVVLYHTAGGFGLKKTIEKDDEPKSKGQSA